MDTRVFVRLFFRGALLQYGAKIYREKCHKFLMDCRINNLELAE